MIPFRVSAQNRHPVHGKFMPDNGGYVNNVGLGSGLEDILDGQKINTNLMIISIFPLHDTDINVMFIAH